MLVVREGSLILVADRLTAEGDLGDGLPDAAADAVVAEPVSVPELQPVH
jgi:hypothetical protein